MYCCKCIIEFTVKILWVCGQLDILWITPIKNRSNTDTVCYILDMINVKCLFTLLYDKLHFLHDNLLRLSVFLWVTKKANKQP